MTRTRVNITSTKTDITWQAEFDTLQEAQAWAEKQVGKPHRLPKRWIKKEQATEEQDFSALAERTQIDSKGNEIVEIQLPAECSIEYIDMSAEVALEEEMAQDKENQEFLNSTDWYMIRELETGVKMPEDIKAARQAARDAIVHAKRQS